MYYRTIVWFLGAGLMAGAVFAAEPQTSPGENPKPIHLIRRPVEPFSAMAKLGHDIFLDTSLSSSGKIACASCHSPDHAYGPPNEGPVMLGGPELKLPGVRAVPSLTYLERQLDFSIGPDDPLNENVNLAQQAEVGKTAGRAKRRQHRAARRPVLGWPRRYPSDSGVGSFARPARDGRRQHRDHCRKTA